MKVGNPAGDLSLAAFPGYRSLFPAADFLPYLLTIFK
jgi:hypothetical protein